MTAKSEQVPSDWPRLLELVQKGEEIVITSHGQIVAKLTGVPPHNAIPKVDPTARISELENLWKNVATGKTGATTDEILDELRSDRF